MTIEQSNGNILRQLESLSPADRQWVLSQITDPKLKLELETELEILDAAKSVQQQSAVDTQQFESTAIPSNGAYAIKSGDPISMSKTETGFDTDGESLNLANLDKVNATQVLSVLQHEPLWIMLVILEAVDCRWKKAVARKSGCRKLLKKYPEFSQTINPAVKNSLLTKFAKKLENSIQTQTGESVSLFEATLNSATARLQYSEQQWAY